MTINKHELDQCFRIRVYDKRKHPSEPFFWISTITLLVLCGAWFLLDDAETSRIPSVIFYIGLALLMVVGVLRLILLWHDLGPIGEASLLTVDENSISFFDTRFRLSSIDKVLVRLNDDRIQYSRNRNNYFEIRTKNGETYKFGILINDSKDEVQVEGFLRILKQKIANFTYAGYL